VMAKNQPGMLRAKPNPGHPGITIGIREIDVIADEHVLIVRAPGG
jgi:hypothetical protein